MRDLKTCRIVPGQPFAGTNLPLQSEAEISGARGMGVTLVALSQLLSIYESFDIRRHRHA